MLSEKSGRVIKKPAFFITEEEENSCGRGKNIQSNILPKKYFILIIFSNFAVS
jgi:hypothetical protein